MQFKKFSQRLEEIEIDVYRSLDHVKSEPSEGSCFFKDCLVEWRVCGCHVNLYLYMWHDCLVIHLTLSINKSHVMAKVEGQYSVDLWLTSNSKFTIISRMHVLIIL